MPSPVAGTGRPQTLHGREVEVGEPVHSGPDRRWRCWALGTRDEPGEHRHRQLAGVGNSERMRDGVAGRQTDDFAKW